MQNAGIASVEQVKASEQGESAPAFAQAPGASPPLWSLQWVLLGAGRLARTLGALLLAATAVLGAIFAFRQGALPLLETAFDLEADAVSAARRIGILCSALLAYGAYVRLFERRAATELVPRPLPVLAAGLGGALLVAVPIALLFALGAYTLVETRGLSSQLAGVAAVILVAATLEELIYRGLLFRIVERGWGTWIALVVQALIFAARHLENVEGEGIAAVSTMLVAVMVVGLLWASVFVLTRSLWAAALNHAAWNFTILLSGVPLSGIEEWRALAPLQTTLTGPDWLSGGMFGPESSVLVMASAGLATVWLLRRSSSKGQIRPLRGSTDRLGRPAAEGPGGAR